VACDWIVGRRSRAGIESSYQISIHAKCAVGKTSRKQPSRAPDAPAAAMMGMKVPVDRIRSSNGAARECFAGDVSANGRGCPNLGKLRKPEKSTAGVD